MNGRVAPRLEQVCGVTAAFCETRLVVMPFLAGDSLLFATSAGAAKPYAFWSLKMNALSLQAEAGSIDLGVIGEPAIRRNRRKAEARLTRDRQYTPNSQPLSTTGAGKAWWPGYGCGTHWAPVYYTFNSNLRPYYLDKWHFLHINRFGKPLSSCFNWLRENRKKLTT